MLCCKTNEKNKKILQQNKTTIAKRQTNNCKTFANYTKINVFAKQQLQSSKLTIAKHPNYYCIFTKAYVSQSCGYSGDDYSGTIWIPLPNGKYLEYLFCC
jgi:hypothetical protein